MAILTGVALAAANAADLCGDQAGSWPGARRHVLAIADGLGHGPDAFAAASRAIGYVGGHLDDEPLALFRGMNEALRDTRGAAVGVAVIAPDEASVTYVAVGNTRAAVFGWQAVRLDGFSGVVGGGYRNLAIRTARFRPDDVLVMWTDGVDERLTLNAPDATLVEPDILARDLLARYRLGGDDCGVLVARFGTE